MGDAGIRYWRGEGGRVMAYYRKTRDEYQIHQWYQVHGWEEVHAEDTRREALARLREYRENQPEVPVRLVKVRVAI